MRKFLNIAVFVLAFVPVQAQVQMLFSSDSLFNITSPLAIDSLYYWFDASQGVTDSLGGAIANNEGVGTWAEQGGRGNNIQQDTNTYRPVWKATGGPGGKPCLQFDGSNDVLIETTNSYWNGDAITIIAVLKFNSATRNTLEIWSSRWNQDGSVAQWLTSGEPSASSYRDAVYTSPDGTTNLADTWQPKRAYFHILSSVLITNTNTSNNYADGAAQTRVGNGVQTGIYNANNKLRIGAYARWLYQFQGSIAEFIVYSKDLSTAERTALETYLNRKYDLY